MKAKSLIGIAVAGALSWSYGAWAGGYERAGNYGHMGLDTTYGAVTPFSPNEAGPAALPHGERYASIGERSDSAGVPVAAIVTPLQDNEAGPHEFALERSEAVQTASVRSMANPQTPWSPNEGGLNTFHEDMDGHAQQVAEVDRTRIAVAEWNANLASSASGADTMAGVSSAEPVGSTAGIGLQGSAGSFGDPSLQPERTGDAGLPSEVERTSAMRQNEYAIPVYEHNTVGILETPAQVTEHTVWSVEPLTPEADLASGSTVYLAPESPEVSFVPDFGSSPLGATGEQSAGVAAEESAEGSAASSL